MTILQSFLVVIIVVVVVVAESTVDLSSCVVPTADLSSHESSKLTRLDSNVVFSWDGNFGSTCLFFLSIVESLLVLFQ